MKLKRLSVARLCGSFLLSTLFCHLSLASQHDTFSSFQYTRTLWRVSDGLPEDTVQALAESGDGHLWIATTDGLARFDGSRLQIYGRGLTQALSGNSVFCLMLGRDGSLWAGTEGNGLFRLRGNEIKTYSAREGLTDGFVRSIYEDYRGHLWVGTDDGLFVMEGDRLRRVDKGSIAPIAVHSITGDSKQRIWVGGSRLIAIDSEGREETFALPGAYSQNRVKRILQAHDGTVWVGTVGGLQSLQQGRFVTSPGIHATVRSLLEAHDGTLWIGTIGDGLWTLRHGQLSQVSRPGLLPSDTVLSILEDGLHQIWIGTQAGLVRLNKTAVSVVGLPENGDPDFETISGDDRGNIWLAAKSLYLIRDGIARRASYDALRNITVRNVYRARNGNLWIGTDGSGVYRVKPGSSASLLHYIAPADLTNNFVRGFLEDRNGTMWIATDEGVSRIGGAAPHKFNEGNGLAFFSTRSMLEDHDGSVWIGTDHGLSHWKDGHFTHDVATHALAQEKVWSILQDRAGTIWFGTRDHGLFRYRNGKMRGFTTAEGLPSNSVYQILQDRNGTYWLSGPNTIASIAAQQMEGSDSLSESPLRVTVYDMPFGADGAQMYGGRQPSGYLAPDDGVWFPTSHGAAHIAHAMTAEGPGPRAAIDDVVQDGRSVPMAPDLHVPANVTRLRFDFSAISLRSQKGVRFRYKLENFDDSWNAPVGDLAATYTNLPAGHYRFRVVAFDTSRPQEVSEADISFMKVPFIYETWWFYTLLFVSLTLLTWLAYRLRVRRIRRQFGAVLEERNRLAREMHDTVIQGCTGLSALLEAMATTEQNGGESKNELLEFARVQARTTINEARHAVWDLRHERENDVDLIEAIDGVVAQTKREFNTEVVFTQNVKQWKIGASAAHEILMTVREAVYNSVQHSGVGQVLVYVEASGNDLSIEVVDRGVGFMPQSESVQQGHYGVVGMEERMHRLGGMFKIASAPGEGTRIGLTFRRSVGQPHA